MTDLIKELRGLSAGPSSEMERIGNKAADHIEKLMKERDDLGRKLNTARYGQPDFAWAIHVEAMADLRAKMTKAVEALRWYDDRFTARKARDVLAELGGTE